MNITEDECVLYIQTVQLATIRTLVVALKDTLNETSFIFQEDGIHITSLDKSRVVVVNMFLEAENFEEYHCKKDKIITGVNMLHFYKLINNIDNQETLTIYIENDDYKNGYVDYLKLQFENKKNNQYKIQHLKLIDPDKDEVGIPDIEYSYTVRMLTSDFQKIIRDINNISEEIEISMVYSRRNDSYEVKFKSVNGLFADSEITRGECVREGCEILEFIKKDSDDIVQDVFSMKHLVSFIKCTNLCNYVEISMKNDTPILIKYDVNTLGFIQFALTSIEV